MATSGISFELPEGFELPPSVDGGDFEALVTLRQMPDGRAVLVALDGNQFSAGGEEPDAELPTDPELPGETPPPETSALDAIENRLEGISPSEITL